MKILKEIYHSLRGSLADFAKLKQEVAEAEAVFTRCSEHVAGEKAKYDAARNRFYEQPTVENFQAWTECRAALDATERAWSELCQVGGQSWFRVRITETPRGRKVLLSALRAFANKLEIEIDRVTKEDRKKFDELGIHESLYRETPLLKPLREKLGVLNSAISRTENGGADDCWQYFAPLIDVPEPVN